MRSLLIFDALDLLQVWMCNCQCYTTQLQRPLFDLEASTSMISCQFLLISHKDLYDYYTMLSYMNEQFDLH